MMSTSHFWESRAARFAAKGRGLRAVCSFGMPAFYNAAIDLTQRAALRALLRSIPRNARVLEYGCGIGRWSRQIARRGAHVTGIDFSETMLAQARQRTAAVGLGGRCLYLRGDVTTIDLRERFDVIVGVTVLQHILDDELFGRAVAGLARHLRPGGRLIMLEAAPGSPDTHADTETFRARPLANYLAAIRSSGLLVEDVRGVDPAPLKLWVVPRFADTPRLPALAALALATLLSLPFDLLLARPLTARSWHKIIVATVPLGVPR